MKTVSLEKRLEVWKQYLSSLSYDEITSKTGVSKGSVFNIITEFKAVLELARVEHEPKERTPFGGTLTMRAVIEGPPTVEDKAKINNFLLEEYEWKILELKIAKIRNETARLNAESEEIRRQYENSGYRRLFRLCWRRTIKKMP